MNIKAAVAVGDAEAGRPPLLPEDKTYMSAYELALKGEEISC